MTRFARLPLCALLVALVVLAPSGIRVAAAAQGASAPKLVVVLVVDQMRADYLEHYSAGFTGGFKRLMKEGAWFQNAAYPYLNTITCAGHATIGTGAFPYRHGMVLNAWFDRQTNSVTECTEDKDTKQVIFGALAPAESDSGKQILVPTLADQVREETRGRVVTMSLKARAAIGLAGHKGDAVIWFDERGAFTTSTAFASAPPPAIADFIEKNPIAADYGKTWDRMRDASTYKNADDGAGERAPSGWTITFPHKLSTAVGKPDAGFYALWERTPYADEYLGRMAAAAVDAMNLGGGAGTDFLGVSFSALDMVGHGFGPNSHEVQDVLARLDITIGRLLDHLDEKVGRGNYVMALGSDHGVAELPEQVKGAGRLAIRDIMDAINTALAPVLGPGRYVAAAMYTDLYLAPGLAERLKHSGAANEAVFRALRGLPGLAYAFRADEISGSAVRTGTDLVKRAAALSYREGRSGDIIIVPKENWLLAASATTHGTLYPYDQRVPVIFFGAGVKPGAYSAESTSADIAPTLAELAKVRFKKLDGQVLKDAVAGK